MLENFCLSPGNGASRILTFIVVTFSSRNFSMFQCWTFLFRNSFCSLGIEAFVNLLQRLQLSNAQESIKKILKLYGSFQRLRNLIKTIRKLNAKSLILSSPLPWYQLRLGGLFHRRRPPTSPPSQFFAPYDVHNCKQRNLSAKWGHLREGSRKMFYWFTSH